MPKRNQKVIYAFINEPFASGILGGVRYDDLGSQSEHSHWTPQTVRTVLPLYRGSGASSYMGKVWCHTHSFKIVYECLPSLIRNYVKSLPQTK